MKDRYEIICKKCDYYISNPFNPSSRYGNVWHIWCRKYEDIENAIETGKCDSHTDSKYHSNVQLKLEALH